VVSPSWDPWCGLNSVTVSARRRLSRSSVLSISLHAFSDGGTAIGVLGQRRVEEVDEVDVEVDGQTVTGSKRREGGSGAAQRIRGGALHVDHGQPAVGDHLSLEVCVRSEPEEADLLGAQHRAPTGKRSEPIDGAVDVEYVRHPHSVQGAIDRAIGHV
jgi:hypothetical protein